MKITSVGHLLVYEPCGPAISVNIGMDNPDLIGCGEAIVHFLLKSVPVWLRKPRSTSGEALHRIESRTRQVFAACSLAVARLMERYWPELECTLRSSKKDPNVSVYQLLDV